MRVLTLVTVVLWGAVGLAGGACSSLLGIEDPTPDPGGDDDPPVTGYMKFSLGDLQIAQRQSVLFHAMVMPNDGGSAQDVTATASYASDNPAVANVSTPGRIDSGTQEGTATITASLNNAVSGRLMVSVSAKDCRPVINELQADGVSASDEWVEILNPCTMTFNVGTWTLVYRGGSVAPGDLDSATLISLSGSLGPGDIKLFSGMGFTGVADGKWSTGMGLNQAAGGVALRMGPKDTGPIADAVAYGSAISGHLFMEGNAVPPMMLSRQSVQRQPFDGRDSDNGMTDFSLATTPSPRTLNVP